MSPGSTERPAPLMNGKKGFKPIRQSNLKIKDTPIAAVTDGLPMITQPKNVLAPVSQGY